MPITSKESTPPPMIGKIGPYTVFVTPPATPSPKPSAPISESPPKNAPSSPPVQPRTPPPVQTPQPPVQAPPQQFLKPAPSDGPAFGFFWNAVAKVQNAHSSLDEYVAHWFGLNQSKYQWALDDYYENKGSVYIQTQEFEGGDEAICERERDRLRNSKGRRRPERRSARERERGDQLRQTIRDLRSARETNCDLREETNCDLQDQVDTKAKDISSKVQSV